MRESSFRVGFCLDYSLVYNLGSIPLVFLIFQAMPAFMDCLLNGSLYVLALQSRTDIGIE